ncbi:hypothetical protein BT96DRAFT_684029 [Gymnopus androsaceus JB14]|uniref:Uncharacterized protein n=1 Tax=Gymnopus androsaceus JB14 TaxID=1447944 RepID=A0A6A4HLC3_9AGAR|nr:hypothetical protein BT96DRAFT_684029 [Gymnopus androsaceus JB14]
MEITEAKSNVSSDTLSSFPPELLTHIFSYGFSKSSSSISSPHNFTQVYSRWRSIAHSSPELWTNLTIELPPALKTEADASKLEERITEWILRSSNLSIDLQVNGPFFRNRQDHPTGLQVDLYTKLYRTIIIDFSNKWRTLIPPYTWEAHDFIASLKELPALQELMLDVRSTCSSSSFPNAAPLLYKLALDLPYDPAVTCLDKIIPETIVNLTLTSAPGIIGLFHDFMQDFLHLSQLQHLTHLELAKLGWREPQVLPSTSFPNLQTFSICGLTAGLENLLDALTLPSLQRLSLKTFRVSGGRSRGRQWVLHYSVSRKDRAFHLSCSA